MARGQKKPTTPTSSAGSRYSFLNREYSDALDLDNVSPEIVGEGVLAVMAMGDAIMFSTTSDGGAARITVFEGDVKHHRYVKSPAELEDTMRGIQQSNQ